MIYQIEWQPWEWSLKVRGKSKIPGMSERDVPGINIS